MDRKIHLRGDRSSRWKTDEMCTLETAAELEFMPGIESKPQIRKVMGQMEPELFDDLLNIKLCLAKEAAKDKDSESVAVRQLERICALRDEIRADGDCISLKMLAVTGNDLIKAGMKPGKKWGRHCIIFWNWFWKSRRRTAENTFLEC